MSDTVAHAHCSTFNLRAQPQNLRIRQGQILSRAHMELLRLCALALLPRQFGLKLLHRLVHLREDRDLIRLGALPLLKRSRHALLKLLALCLQRLQLRRSDLLGRRRRRLLLRLRRIADACTAARQLADRLTQHFVLVHPAAKLVVQGGILLSEALALPP